MGENEWASVTVSNDRLNELQMEKLDRFSRVQIIEWIQGLRARDMLRLARLLIRAVGKEKAMEMYEKETYDDYYKVGREMSEKLGHPQDLDTYLNIYAIQAMANIPDVQPPTLFQRSGNKVVWGVRQCYFAEALQKYGDPELIDVVKKRCCHDEAWARGFNPKLKCRKTRFLLDGDDACEFTCEIEE